MEASTLPLQATAAHAPAGTLDAPAGEPIRVEQFAGVEDYLRAYLGDARFRAVHSSASERWSDASSALYDAACREDVLAAVERAREALREFSGALAADAPPSFATAATVGQPDALVAVLRMHRPRVGDMRGEFLESLLEYWRVLNDVVQRHENGAQDVAEPVRWEDARRVIVLTALVMVEVDRSL
jgi:hypothetical protein